MVRAEDFANSANYGTRQFVLQVTPISIDVQADSWANAGSEYTATFTATGATNPVTWALDNGSLLPPGLTLSSDGVISGTPDSAGRYCFSVTATETGTGNSQTRGVCIDLYPAGGGPPLQLLNAGNRGEMRPGSLALDLQATGGTPPYNFAYVPGTEIAGLRVQNGVPQPDYWDTPPPASLVGVIVPPADMATAAAYSTTIQVSDSGGHTAQGVISFTLSPLIITTHSFPPRAMKNVPYSFTLTATGGTEPYAWEMAAGTTLPPGLHLTGGVISGVPTTAGDYCFNVDATDASGNRGGWGLCIGVDAIAITPGPVLPQGTLNSPYSVTLAASGGSGPYTWQAWGVPQGLNMDPTSGVISGTLQSSYHQSFTIEVRDSLGATTRRNFWIPVSAQPREPLTVQTATNLDVVVGEVLFYGLQPMGGMPPYTWSVEPGSTLPQGLSLAYPAQDVTEWGAPGQTMLVGASIRPDTYTFTLRLTDAEGHYATQPFTVNVRPICIQPSYLPLRNTTLVYKTPYSQPLLAMGGTGIYTWSAESPLPRGLSLDTATGVVSGTPLQTGGNLGFWAQVVDGRGDRHKRWINVSVSSGTANTLEFHSGPDLGTVNRSEPVSLFLGIWGSPLSNPNYSVALVEGALPAGITINGDRLVGIPQEPGTFNFRLEVRDASGNLGAGAFTLRVLPFYIYTQSLTEASAAQPYSQALIAFGEDSPVWSLAPGSSLPDGMTIADGVLTGSPRAAGDYRFDLMVSGSGVSVARTFSLHVSPIAITSPTILPTAVANAPYSYTLAATGGGESKTWSLDGGGPAISSSGMISGNFGPGLVTFRARVSDGTNTAVKQFVIPVAQDHPPIMSVSMDASRLPDATVNALYQQQLQVDGGKPPYAWSVAAGSTLPAGLRLLDGAAIPNNTSPGTTWVVGIPTVVHQNTFVLEIADGSGAVLRRTFSLNVSPLRLMQSTEMISFQEPSTIALTASGGTPPYRYAIVSGDLPAGMTLDKLTGVISGTPLATPWDGPVIEVTDSTRPVQLNLRRQIAIRVQVPTGQNPWAMGTWIWSWGGAAWGINGGMGVWGGTPPYHWTVEPGSVPASAVFNDPNSPFPTFASTSFPTGEHMFLARVTDSQGNFQVAQTKWKSEDIYVPRCYLPQGRAGQPYQYQFRAFGANPPFTYSEPEGITPLPPGLSVSPTGLITGVIPESGRFAINLKITDALGKWVNWGSTATILSPDQISPLVSMDAGLPNGSVGVIYHYSLAHFVNGGGAGYLGGVPPFTWTVEPGSDLPPGLVLVPGSGDTGAYLTGVPTTRGDYQFVLRQTDSAGQTILRTFTMYVSAISLPPLPPRATVGVPYTYTLAASGGEPPYTFTLSSGSVPEGMRVEDGRVTGTPTTAGAYFLNFTVTDSTGDHYSPNWYRLFVDASNNVFPNTVVTPGTLSILWYQGDPAPAAINISHGPNTLDFTASVIGIPGASLSVTSGTTPRSTSLLLDPAALAGLSVGDHWGVVVFKVPAAGDEDDEVVPVKLTVAPPPPCPYAVSPDNVTIQSTGGSGSLTITAAPYCSWTAIPSEPWVVLTSAASGAGNGTVTYTLTANPGTDERTSSIAVNGAQQRIKQFGSACGYYVSPQSVLAPAAGGTANVTVTASLAGCTWTAASSDAWLHAPAGGSGSGTIAVTVDPNTGDGRSGSVSVAGQNVTVSQSAAACTISLNAGIAEMTAAGGSGSVGVIRSRPDCPYSVVEGPSWITLTSPSAPEIVTYTVAPNSSTQARSGSLLIGGQVYRIVQSGVSCNFSVTGNNPLFGSGGGTGSISIDANASACPWTASSNSSWLTISSQASGSGSYVMQFSVGANPTATARQGTVTVAGQTVTVSQSGVACSYTLRSTDGAMPSSGGFSSVGVLAPTGCGWSASTAADWIVIKQPSGSSSGEVAFEVLPNASPAPRTGSIAVQDRVYTLTQSGVPCSYAMSPASATHADNAGTGSFNYTAGAEGCPADPVSYNDWIAVASAGGGTVSYTVAANPTAGSRTGRIRLGDKIFTVVQTAGVCSWNLNVYGAVYSSSGGGGDVLASPSQAGCSPPPVGSSPEITLAALSGPQAGIYTQPYTVPVFNSLVTWIRLLYIDVGGQLFTVKQTSW